MKIDRNYRQTTRYCGICNKTKKFQYNRNIGHSECTGCGYRFSFKDKETYIAWKKSKEQGDKIEY